MVTKKLVEIDKGAYKLIVEVEYDTIAELPLHQSQVAQAISDAVEKAKSKDDKKKKKG